MIDFSPELHTDDWTAPDARQVGPALLKAQQQMRATGHLMVVAARIEHSILVFDVMLELSYNEIRAKSRGDHLALVATVHLDGTVLIAGSLTPLGLPA